MELEIVFVALFALSTAVAIAARRFKLPYTVALVVTGLVIGNVHLFQAPHLTKHLLYGLFLPGLLFEAAFHLEFKRFWSAKLTVGALAFPGLAAAVVLTAVMLAPAANALEFVSGFEIEHALVLAAVLAATDPIAVTALFKSLGVPARLGVLVEGESLLNDGTSVILFTLVVGLVAGGDLSAGAATLDFVKVVGMGALIGLALGYVVSRVIHLIDDPMIEITLTTIAGYGSFAVAEHLHFSGVLATVCAGMLCGNYAARTGMSPSTRIAAESFWEYLAFALNSLVFLLIGFEVDLSTLAAAWKPILAAYVAVTIGRAAMIFVTTALLRRTAERVPWSWATILTWGGLRGGLSMVLVLGLPRDFPHRELLVTTTYGVVILSILLQGMTMSTLLRWLVPRRGGERTAYEEQCAVLFVAGAAREALAEMRRAQVIHPDVAAALEAEYDARMRAAEQGLRDLHLEQAELRHEELLEARRRLLVVEKDQLQEALRRGRVGHAAFERMLHAIDEQIVALDGEEPPGPPAEPPAASGGDGDQSKTTVRLA